MSVVKIYRTLPTPRSKILAAPMQPIELDSFLRLSYISNPPCIPVMYAQKRLRHFVFNATNYDHHVLQLYLVDDRVVGINLRNHNNTTTQL